MIALAVAVAHGAPDDASLATIARLEWDRQAPVQLGSQIAGGDSATRIAAVRALGRLRTEESLPLLRAWMDDPEPAVRAAVAEALGWTPGAGELLREWWSRGAEGDRTVAAAILVGLGHQGDVRDVQALVAALGETGPVAASAARALGWFGTRAVPGLEVTVGPLVDHLDTFDPRVVDAVAWALARLKKPIPVERVDDVLRAVDTGASVEARAWLLKAVWPTLARDERDERFLAAMTDAPRLVQVTVLNALGADDADPEVLAGFLHDSDVWVRYAAIDAIGRHPATSRADILRGHLSRVDDPWEQARVVRALATPDEGKAADATLPVVVRAAWVETLDDESRLVDYAVDSADPPLRSAAAGALSERTIGVASFERLARAADPVVRQVAMDRGAALPPQAVAAVVVDVLAGERDPAVISAAWGLLDAAVAADRRALPRGDARAKALLAKLTVADAPTGAHARAVAAALGLPAPDPAPPARPEAWTVDAAGGTVEVAARPADLVHVREVRSARIRTDQGEFVVAFDPERAPLAVATFAALADAHFYDGLVFHRVVPGFVVQTGCPRGDGWGGPGFTLPDEDTETPFDAGSLGMARETARDTAGSQWFVTTADQPHLTSEYTRFGQVVHGMHVVDRLRQGAVVESVEIERVPRP